MQLVPLAAARSWEVCSWQCLNLLLAPPSPAGMLASAVRALMAASAPGSVQDSQ